jgi:DNA-binding NtrC family response regulator
MSTSLRARRTCNDIRVVVVDDAATFRHALAENLRDDGHSVREHADPREVGSLDDVDVMITDFEMGSMDGVAYADLVHKARPRIVVVLITAYWTVEIESALALRPFVRLWRKPVDYDLVHAELHAWVEAASG